MKVIIVLLCTIFITLCSADFKKTPEQQWIEYKKEFNKVYKNPEEEAARKDIFFENLKIVDEHNMKAVRGELTYWLGINKYSDLTQEEFRAVFHGDRQLPTESTVSVTSPISSGTINQTSILCSLVLIILGFFF